MELAGGSVWPHDVLDILGGEVPGFDDVEGAIQIVAGLLDVAVRLLLLPVETIAGDLVLVGLLALRESLDAGVRAGLVITGQADN